MNESKRDRRILALALAAVLALRLLAWVGGDASPAYAGQTIPTRTPTGQPVTPPPEEPTRTPRPPEPTDEPPAPTSTAEPTSPQPTASPTASATAGPDTPTGAPSPSAGLTVTPPPSATSEAPPATPSAIDEPEGEALGVSQEETPDLAAALLSPCLWIGLGLLLMVAGAAILLTKRAAR